MLIDTIRGISGHPMSGLWNLEFESGRNALIGSGYGVRALAAAFGATEGSGDLIDCITGQEIVWECDAFGVMEWFCPVDEYDGPLDEVEP